MRKILLALALFLFVMPAAYADDAGDASKFEDFYSSASSSIDSASSTFMQSFETAGGTVPATFNSVLSAFDPGYCGPEWVLSDPGMIIGTWLMPAIFMAMIIIFGIAILYMGGQLLQSPNIITVAKDELYQTAMTVLRIVFIMGCILGANLFFNMAAGGTTGDPIYDNPDVVDMFDAATAFARKMVVEMVDNYSLLVMYNMVIHTIYSSTMWVGVSFRAMYNFNLGPVLKPLIDIIGTATQYLSLAMSEWMVHIILLCFIKRWMWGLFIPLGMVLRIIPYTRNAGEALLMLVLALGTIYPFMFIFDYEAHKIMEPNLANGSEALNSLITKSGLFSLTGSLIAIALLAGGVIFPFFIGSAVSVAFELIRGSVYYIVMMGMLLPFLNIFVTLTLAREWARAFNVNVNYLSFLKII